MKLSAMLTGDRNSPRTVMQTIIALIAVAIFSVAALRDVVLHPDTALVKSDFAAFYCGAVTTVTHGDPYALEPLAACEYDRAYREGGVSRATADVDPDPLPGYNMAFFRPFTLLPFRSAALVFDAILVAAIAGTALILAELTGLPIIVIGAVLAYVDIYTSVPYGQTAPLAALGLSLAAYGLARDRRFMVLGGAAITMLIPHVGVAVCAAILIWCPRFRAGILLIGAVLAAASIATLGLPISLEYVGVALPAQALAESGTTMQYGLAWLLQYVGVAAPLAIKVASLQYSVFLVACVALARTVARRLQMNAAIVLFPAVAVLLGGPYVHVQQMVLALPFALLLAVRTRSGPAWLAVALIAVPWPADTHVLLAGGLAVVATIVLAALPSANMRTTSVLVCAGIVAYGVVAGPIMTRLVPAHPEHVLAATPAMPHALDGSPLAAQADADEVRADPGAAIATPRTLISKLPIWFALAMLCALAFVRKPQDTSRLSIRNDKHFGVSAPVTSPA